MSPEREHPPGQTVEIVIKWYVALNPGAIACAKANFAFRLGAPAFILIDHGPKNWPAIRAL